MALTRAPKYLDESPWGLMVTRDIARIIARQSRRAVFAYESTKRILWVYRNDGDLKDEIKLDGGWICLGSAPCLKWSKKRMRVMDTNEHGSWWTWEAYGTDHKPGP